MKGNQTLKPRRQRRQEAREKGIEFKPIYAEGLEPKRRKDYERFDGKYVKVSDKVSKGRD